MEKESKRVKIYINKYLQRDLILQFVAVNFQAILIFSIILYYILYKLIFALIPSERVDELSQILFPPLAGYFLLYIIISSCLIGFYILYSSHKIAGPIHRFNTAIIEMKDGNLLPHLELRKTDHLSETLTLMKDFSKTLSDDVKEITVLVKEIHDISKNSNDPVLMSKLELLNIKLGKYRM